MSWDGVTRTGILRRSRFRGFRPDRVKAPSMFQDGYGIASHSANVSMIVLQHTYWPGTTSKHDNTRTRIITRIRIPSARAVIRMEGRLCGLPGCLGRYGGPCRGPLMLRAQGLGLDSSATLRVETVQHVPRQTVLGSPHFSNTIKEPIALFYFLGPQH